MRFLEKIKQFQNNYFDLKNRDRIILSIEISIIILIFIIIFLSIPHSSFQSYFWVDFKFAQFSHLQNLNKNFLEVLSNPGNVLGITTWILEPSLNFLSNLNYLLDNKKDYYKYLSIFRFLEILTTIIFVYTFSRKFKIEHLIIILILNLILIVNFNRYDHESYINFPIIIFCLSHIIAIKLKNNFFYFIIILLGNLWAYLINPIYFFNICFFPLIFFYSYLLYEKEYKKFFITLFTNLPFTIFFIFLSLGTSRLAINDLFVGSIENKNYALFTSENFVFISIIFFILSVIILIKKNNFFAWFFLGFTAFTLLSGYLFSLSPQNWKIPPPFQFEYSIQYILILVFFKLIEDVEKNIISAFVLIILITLFTYRSYFFINSFYTLNFKNNEIEYINDKKTLIKKYFWSKLDNKFFLEKDLKNKKVLLFLPNINSKFHNSYNSDLNNISEMEAGVHLYNKNLKSSLLHLFFWNKNISTVQGYSHHLDINTTLANYFNPSFKIIYDNRNNKKYKINFTDNRYLDRQTVPKLNYKNDILNFYKIDFILSDIVFDKNQENLILIKTYSFDNFELYLYEKTANKVYYNIDKKNKIKNNKDYYKNTELFSKEVFVYDSDFEKIKNVDYFCKVENVFIEKKKYFNVSNPNKPKNCLAIFPIPYSNNNKFVNEINGNCSTFRSQFYFHACIIKKDGNYLLKKENLILYPFGSLRDYKEFKSMIN